MTLRINKSSRVESSDLVDQVLDIEVCERFVAA